MKIDAPSAQEQVKRHREPPGRSGSGGSAYTAIPASDDERETLVGLRGGAPRLGRRPRGRSSRSSPRTLAGARRDAIDLSIGEAADKFERARSAPERAQRDAPRAGRRSRQRREGAAAVRLAWLDHRLGRGRLHARPAARLRSRALDRATPPADRRRCSRTSPKGRATSPSGSRVGSSDEIGELARWFNCFMDRLHEIIGQVAEHRASTSPAPPSSSRTASRAPLDRGATAGVEPRGDGGEPGGDHRHGEAERGQRAPGEPARGGAAGTPRRRAGRS